MGRRILLLCLVALTKTALAEQKPLWELGFGLAPITFPNYRGSDEQSAYVLPLPYVIYRGDRFKVDRSGPRGVLFDSDRIDLDLSLSASVPVESNDNDARRGMPDLDPTAELGPVLKFHFTEKNAPLSLRFELPVRAVFAIDSSSIEHVGFLAAPALWIERRNIAGGWNVSVGAGPLFADAEYHDYYYSVPAQFATLERPAYGASGGYSGTSVLVGASRRFQRVWAGAFVRYDHLSGVDFDDSPLFKTDHAFMAGFGIAWIFAQSKTLVEAER